MKRIDLGAIYISIGYRLVFVHYFNYCFRSVTSRHVFKLNAPDHSVARFIKQSVHHLGLLETSLAHLGTVEICISALKSEDKDKIVDYCCRPLTVSCLRTVNVKLLFHEKKILLI